MEVFADTSGLYAVLDAGDRFHRRAAEAWKQLTASHHEIISHHFVLLEAWSLIQARLGFQAIEVFQRDFRPLVTFHPVSESILGRGVTRCAVARRRDLSLTDCISLESMKEHGIHSAFAFDRHFREAGHLLAGNPRWLEPHEG